MSNNDTNSDGNNNKSGFEEQQAFFATGKPNDGQAASDILPILYAKHLIKNLKFIVLAAFLGLGISVLAWFQLKDSVSVEFSVREISTYESSRYLALNTFKPSDVYYRPRATSGEASKEAGKETDKEADKEESILVPFSEINAEELLSRYIDKLYDQQSTFNIAQASGLYTHLTNEDRRNSELVDFVNEISIAAPANEDIVARGRGSSDWKVRLESHGRSETQKFLQEWLNQTTADVRSELIDSLQTTITVNETEASNLYSELLNERQAIVADHERKMAREIETLKEDAAVARSAGIKSNTLTGSAINGANGFIAIQQENPDRYLRGYQSLEKERELLQNRENSELFAEALDDVDQHIKKLQSDKSIERMKQVLEESPLKTGGFKAVLVDPNFIDIEPRFSPILIVALGTILGAFIGFLITTGMFLNRTFLKSEAV
jgi:LPS O-antigen subunit length determinant protein (WzzB/FepE family)